MFHIYRQGCIGCMVGVVVEIRLLKQNKIQKSIKKKYGFIKEINELISMTKYTCNFCSREKNIKSKQTAKNHLTHSHKKIILDLEVRNTNKSVQCVYCGKYIEGSIKSHLGPHINNIITKFFDQYMLESP